MSRTSKLEPFFQSKVGKDFWLAIRGSDRHTDVSYCFETVWCTEGRVAMLVRSVHRVSGGIVDRHFYGTVEVPLTKTVEDTLSEAAIKAAPKQFKDVRSVRWVQK